MTSKRSLGWLAMLSGLVHAACAPPEAERDTRTRATNEQAFDDPSALRGSYIEDRQRSASAEYELEQDWTGGVRGTNHAQGWRLRIDAPEVHLLGARGDDGDDVALTLVGFGRGDHPSPPPEVGRTSVVGNEVRLSRSGVVEWYLNGPLGLEQGFDLMAPPSGDEPTTLVVQIRGATIAQTDRGRIELTTEGGSLLRYGELLVRDALGRAVPARATAEVDTIALRIDDAGFEYPLRVDPLVGAEQQKLTAAMPQASDAFGIPVTLDGDTALIGAQGNNAHRGCAYVYVKTGGVWVEQQKLAAPDASPSDYFGQAAALSGDAALVGAWGDDLGPGAEGSAYVFKRAGGVWTLQQKLTPPDATYTFGQAVALQGTTAAIGAPQPVGAVYVYVESNGVWSLQQKLTAADAQNGDWMGISVAIDADTLVAGASSDSDPVLGLYVGSAYVFVRSGSLWSQQQKLASPDPAAGDYFGNSVAVEGDTALVGEYFDDNANGSYAGAAHVFGRVGSVWTATQKLVPAAAVAGSVVGSAVAMRGDVAIIGAENHPAKGLTNAGAAFYYARSGQDWSEVQQLEASDANANDNFGASVAVAGKTALVGAYFATELGLSLAGAAYVYNGADQVGAPCALGADCVSGFCADGVCCDSDCGGGADDCQACSVLAGASVDGACAPLAQGTPCRPAAGVCDLAETCDGVAGACPPDVVAPAATTCRAALDVCDVEEACDGAAADCPPDALEPAGTECRASTGACDAPESCDGAGVACPADEPAADGAACDDGDACTANDQCANGICQPGQSGCAGGGGGSGGSGGEASTGGSGGAGGAGAGPQQGGGGAGSTADLGEAPSDKGAQDGGCGCHQAGAGFERTPLALLTLALVTLLRRRRCQVASGALDADSHRPAADRPFHRHEAL